MSQEAGSALITRLEPHPLREELYGELHARPTPLLEVPLRASHVVFANTIEEMAASRDHVARLAKRYGTSAPVPDASHYVGDFGGFELRWERHTEFCNYTVVRPGCGADPFGDTAFGLLPVDWVEAIPGRLVVACHAPIAETGRPEPTAEELGQWFEGQLVSGSRISGGRASVWTSFRMHRDGFSRYLIVDNGLSPFQAGRTLQRLLELETYRVMSLLALPVARELAQETTRLDNELAAIMDQFMTIRSTEDERRLLEELSALAATVEHHRSLTNYRFGATRAYYSLVSSILENLREEHFPGMSSLGKFLDRRLTPGVRTCFAMEARLENLSQRVGRAGELLQARISVGIETQNQSLLSTMNRRSGMQLRLQQTVEGLSVAAISYYSVALLKILFESLEDLGAPINPPLAIGITLPLVVVGVWALVRRIRHKLSEGDS
jgi:uncharacterized membrane-anchored protein